MSSSIPVAGKLRIVFWLLLVIAVIGAAWITRFGSRWPSVYFMTGPSMEPTISAEEYFLVWSPPGEVSRGDLIIFRFHDPEGDLHVLRRVAALPGDTISMERGRVVVNGRVPDWPFRVLKEQANRSEFARVEHLYTWGPWIVPPDSVVLLSDTRDMIGWPDSRFLGFIPEEDIVGRATVTLKGRLLR